MLAYIRLAGILVSHKGRSRAPLIRFRFVLCSGCRSCDHFTGTTGSFGASMVTLHVVTNGACKGLANGCKCRSCKDGLSLIVSWRIHCSACGNNAERCREGQGEPGDFAALEGCAAFTEAGKVRPKKAKKAPAQPWDVKAA